MKKEIVIGYAALGAVASILIVLAMWNLSIKVAECDGVLVEGLTEWVCLEDGR